MRGGLVFGPCVDGLKAALGEEGRRQLFRGEELLLAQELRDTARGTVLLPAHVEGESDRNSEELKLWPARSAFFIFYREKGTGYILYIFEQKEPPYSYRSYTFYRIQFQMRHLTNQITQLFKIPYNGVSSTRGV